MFGGGGGGGGGGGEFVVASAAATAAAEGGAHDGEAAIATAWKELGRKSGASVSGEHVKLLCLFLNTQNKTSIVYFSVSSYNIKKMLPCLVHSSNTKPKPNQIR